MWGACGGLWADQAKLFLPCPGKGPPMAMSGLRQIAQMRLPLFLTIGLAALIASLASFGLVSDLVAASILFTLLALPMTVLVFWAARYLHLRIRRARMAALREEDRRNRDYMIAILSLCRSLVLGAEKMSSVAEAGQQRKGDNGKAPSPGVAAANMSTMRHIAHHIGAAKAQHGHLLSAAGQRAAERVKTAALNVVSGTTCENADYADLLSNLDFAMGAVLNLDDAGLERRRMVAAGAEDPAPE